MIGKIITETVIDGAEQDLFQWLKNGGYRNTAVETALSVDYYRVELVSVERVEPVEIREPNLDGTIITITVSPVKFKANMRIVDQKKAADWW